MVKMFKTAGHLTWNLEVGRVSGGVERVHAKNLGDKSYVHHASNYEPQHEIKSDKSDHIALHKAPALICLS